MKTIFGFLIIALFGCALGQINVAGPCRSLPIVTDFDPTRYIGVWYQLARYDNPDENGLDCNTASYTLNEEGFVDVLNAGTFLDTEQHVFIEGQAYISFPDEVPLRALLNVTFFGAPADRVNYGVVETDYDNYALVWNCVDQADGTANEYTYILARAYTVSGAEQDRVDELISLYLDETQLRQTVQDQGRCLGGGIEPAITLY